LRLRLVDGRRLPGSNGKKLEMESEERNGYDPAPIRKLHAAPPRLNSKMVDDS
jgi:hypothetical protein